MVKNYLEMQILAQKIRGRVIEISHKAQKGHIGSALSICELVVVISLNARGLGTSDPKRDRVVMSKGHAALAWYSVLEQKGIILTETLETYMRDGSLLGTHPDPELAGVDFMTGSLGQGIGYGVGAALSGKIAKDDRRVFVVLSDSELNEGSTWESAALAGQLKLKNLIVFLDLNGQQALGKSKDILPTSTAVSGWSDFGWNVHRVDGHSTAELQNMVDEHFSGGTGPLLVMASTVAGKGVSFMEGQVKWHYTPMSSEEFEDANSQSQLLLKQLQNSEN